MQEMGLDLMSMWLGTHARPNLTLTPLPTLTLTLTKTLSLGCGWSIASGTDIHMKRVQGNVWGSTPPVEWSQGSTPRGKQAI